MKKFFSISSILILMFLGSCGTPNEPESIAGGDGGYKIVANLATYGFAQDVVVRDTLAFITQGEGGMMIADISDPASPVELSTVFQDLKGYSNKIDVKDSVVYVSAGAFGVSVIDASDPYNPQVTATNLAIKPGRGFDIMDNWLFSAIGEYGFKVSDISYATQPDLRAETFTPGYAQAVCVSPDRNYLLVACGEMGLSVFYIHYMYNGYGPYQMTSWADTPGYAEDVAVHPDLPYAFIACGTAGLYIADYSDSANIKIISSYSTGGYAKEVVYKDNKVYISTGVRGVQILDVSNILSPVRIGTVATKNARGLTADEKYIYVADDTEGLVIISVP
jgi:hypothetical protein